VGGGLAGLPVRPFGAPRGGGGVPGGSPRGRASGARGARARAGSLFPPASLGVLNALSQVGMVLYMFLIGLELDHEALSAGRGAAVLTSHASIAVPFALGVSLALAVHHRFAPDGIPFVAFALFLGAAMSVTAFPVLARIL